MKKEDFKELKQSVIDAGRIKRGEIPASRVFEANTETGEITQIDPLEMQRHFAREHSEQGVREQSQEGSRRSAA